MYQPLASDLVRLALLGPAIAAATLSETAALVAERLTDLSIGNNTAAPVEEPLWQTPHRIALELATARLRDFSIAAAGTPTLIVAPLALHNATVIDLIPGQSLVATLREAGIGRLFAVDWRSATDDMRYLTIDDYLASLNVQVDELGGAANLIGLCQGGWLSLLYAARFPGKVRKLVLGGAPINLAAADSAISTLVGTTPPVFFDELVKLGKGRVSGSRFLSLWAPGQISPDDIRTTLEIDDDTSGDHHEAETIFSNWFAWTVDLPGAYYLETVERLFRRNELASGAMRALGKPVSLSTVRAPLYLLAARDDELVAPAQLFSAAELVGTEPSHIHRHMTPGGHLGLFLGRRTLRTVWPRIAEWLNTSDSEAHAAAGD
ncbi:MAG: alpha/beta fold hydrolase [Proteobacteria bacterium]|nr:alpha/beta fold hydrolase [Pseudomonadota bacterium]